MGSHHWVAFAIHRGCRLIPGLVALSAAIIIPNLTGMVRSTATLKKCIPGGTISRQIVIMGVKKAPNVNIDIVSEITEREPGKPTRDTRTKEVDTPNVGQLSKSCTIVRGLDNTMSPKLFTPRSV